MSLSRFPNRWLIACLPLLALTMGNLFADTDVDPEPLSDTRTESASPAVDLVKAKTDRKLAEQADSNQKASSNNLRKIGIAVHNYHDAHSIMPDDFTDKKGKACLSWRVALLPYLEQEKLYKEFKLDEPWDSNHNKKLIAKMPAVFASPRVKVQGKGKTVYQVFTGANATFGRPNNRLRIVSITDGTSNTILAVETSDATPWTKPGGIPFDPNKVLPQFGKSYGKKPLTLMWDGSIRILNLDKIQAQTLKAAITPQGGEVLGNDWNN